MDWLPRLLCCIFLFLSLAAAARAGTVHQEWEISYQFKSPDCVRKLAVTINGQAPGPTIRAAQGDTVVVVRVKNSLLTENVAIHWHGIRQIGTPWADGTEGVTQCPILPGDTFTYTFVVDRPGTYMYHANYGMQGSAGLNGLIVVAAKRGRPDAEPFAYDRDHDVLHKITYEQAPGFASVPLVSVGEPHQSLLINGRSSFVNCCVMAAGACTSTLPECATPVSAIVPDAQPFWYDGEHDVLHKITYEQATGLVFVPLVSVGEPQSLLINGRSSFVKCCAMAAGACNGTLPECTTPMFTVVPEKTHRFHICSVTSLSAVLNFEIEDRNARLNVGYPAPAVASGATSSRRPPMGYEQYAAALVVVMVFATLYIANGRPVADQNPPTAGGTIAMSAPAPSASGSLPVGGGHAPPPSSTPASSPSISSCDPAGTSSNSSGNLSTPPSEVPPVGTGEEPSSPHRSSVVGAAPDEGQLSSFLLGFLGAGIPIMAGIYAGFERIVSGWSRGTKVVYEVSTWLATVFLGFAVLFMVAWYGARSRKLLSISEFCAKLGVILYIDLVVVIIPCRLGRGACLAAIPSVAVITFLTATVRIWGHIIIRILGPRRRSHTQTRTGDDMA